MKSKKTITPDSVISCLGLATLLLTVGAAIWILVIWQIVPWLREGAWYSYPISSWLPIRILLGLACS